MWCEYLRIICIISLLLYPHCHPNNKYVKQNTKDAKQNTKDAKQNTNYAKQNTKYAKENTEYAKQNTAKNWSNINLRCFFFRHFFREFTHFFGVPFSFTKIDISNHHSNQSLVRKSGHSFSAHIFLKRNIENGCIAKNCARGSFAVSWNLSTISTPTLIHITGLCCKS